jgi:hypothetical protein
MVITIYIVQNSESVFVNWNSGWKEVPTIQSEDYATLMSGQGKRTGIEVYGATRGQILPKFGTKCKVTGKYSSISPWRIMREWRYSSTILFLGARWRWVVLSLNPRGNNPESHFIGSWVDPGAGMDPMKTQNISCPYQESNPPSFSHPALA